MRYLEISLLCLTLQASVARAASLVSANGDQRGVVRPCPTLGREADIALVGGDENVTRAEPPSERKDGSSRLS
jgi:hypothetical protein